MAETRLRSQWDHTSALMAIQAELNRDHKKRSQPFTFRDFHPYYAQAKDEPAVSGWDVLKSMYRKPKPNEGATDGT